MNDKVQCIQTMELVLKRKGIIKYATTRIELEDIK